MNPSKPKSATASRRWLTLSGLTLAAAGLSLAPSSVQAQADYPGAVWRPVYSGHWNTGGSGHKFHVIHDIEGYYASTISYFQRSTTQASIHFYVNGKKDANSDAPAGEVAQGVRVAYYAWHARCWNGHSTGTEHEGFASNPAWYTPEMYQSSANLTAWIANRFGWAKDRNHVVGHDQKRIAGWASWASANLGINGTCNDHTDPGPYWDWNGYMAKVNGGGSMVGGAILTRYNQLGGSGGILGAATTYELTCPDGVGKFNHFARPGSIYWTPGTGAWEIYGAIRDKWASQGWERSYLGYPTSGENGTPNGAGRYNHFQRGSIYYSGATGAHAVQGDIHTKWAALGWENSYVGFPTTDELDTPGNTGKYNHFQNGSIYWSPATGAHNVQGAIRDKWASQGWQSSYVGFPTTDELNTPDGIGKFNHFQSGSIYWTPGTGAHTVQGAIHTKWTALGYEQSYLGYPTSSELDTPGAAGKYNTFQRGAIYWTGTLGAHNVQGAIYNKWIALGGHSGSLGFPTSDEYDFGSNQKRNDFQNGWIIYNVSTLQFIVGGSAVGSPAAPTALSATAAGNLQVNLAWTDNSSDETGFVVERSVGSANNFTQLAITAANVTTYQNPGLVSGTTYYYRVRATKPGSGDTTYDSLYSNTASATPIAPPDLAAIGNKTVNGTSLITFTATSSNPNQLVNSSVWATWEGNNHNDQEIVFRKPGNSASTSAFLDPAVTNYTIVSSAFPAGGAGGARVVKSSWSFKTGTSNYWIRLTTAGGGILPNPTISLDQVLRFKIYSTKALSVGLGVRETGTTAAYGANGGTTGTIDWTAVSSVASGNPVATKAVAANTWTTVDINVPFEAQAAFTGDGIVSGGKGVLEHLILRGAGGTGVYDVYLDDMTVVESNTLTYSLDAGAPSGASIHPKTGKFAWTPTAGQGGAYAVTVRVTDRLGQTDAETINITVNISGNAAPVLSAIGNKTVNEGTALAFTAAATDANVGQTLAFSLDAGAPSGASITTGGAFSWTPTEAQGPGTYPITVRVTDNGAPASNAFETITVTVNEANVAPVLATIANQTVNEGATLSLTASATDADLPANTLTYTLGANAPAGMTINPTSGAISWTTTEANGPGTNSVTVTATDAGGLNNAKTFTVVVNEVNAAPTLAVNTTLTSVEPVTDFEAYQAGSYNGTVLFRQPLYSATTSSFLDTTVTNLASIVDVLPAGNGSLSAFYATWSFKTGTVNPWVRLTTYNTATLPNPTVNFDQRLKFKVWSDKALKVGLGLRETASTVAIGANGGITGSIEWTGVSGLTGSTPNPTRTINASNWTTLEFILPSEAVTAFTGNGILASGKGVLESLALVPAGGAGIYNVYFDDLQVVTVKTNLVIDTGSTLTLTAVGSDTDAPAQGLSYSLDAGAPAGAVIDSSTGVFSWTPTGAQGPSTNAVTVRVTDNGPGSLSATQVLSIVVNKVNTAPQITGVPDQALEINGGTSLNLTVTASDSDVPTNTLTFSLQGSVPSGAAIDPATGVFTWTPPNTLSSNVITVRVTDNGTPALYDERDMIIIVVPANTAPSLSLGVARVTEKVVNYESVANYANDTVMFRRPSNSSSTSSFLDTAVTNYSMVISSGIPAGNPNAGAKVQKLSWSFKTGTTNPWLRMTTFNSSVIPNPLIDLGARVKFDIYVDKAVKVGLGLRETGGAGAIGSNGGTTGGIEWVGAGKTGTSPNPSRVVNAGVWTTLEFTLPSEACTNFSGGDNVLATGKGVLEHLAIVPNGGMGVYTLYVDNLEVVSTLALPSAVSMNANSTLTYTASATDPDPGSGLEFGLDADTPAGSTINSVSGAFTWTPTAAGSYSIITYVNDNPVNGAYEKTTSSSFNVTVSADPLGVQGGSSDETAVGAGETVTLTWTAEAGQSYQVQVKEGADGAWTDLGTPVTGGSATVTNGDADSSYRIVAVGAAAE